MPMISRKQLRALVAPAIAFLLCVGLAHDADAARKMRATGFYRNNLGQIDIPLQFVASLPGMTGGHSVHLGFPQDDAMVDVDIAVVGKSPAAFTIPGPSLPGAYSALAALGGTLNVQITTMFTGTFPAAPAMLSAAGGPGSFSFCPGSVPGTPGAACPTTAGSVGTGFMMGGAPNLMTNPQGTGTRNGRIVYLGGGGFGGVAQTILGGSGALTAPRVGFAFGSPIFQAAQRPIAVAPGMTMSVQAPGGSYGATGMRYALPFSFTQPRTAPTTMGTISGMQKGPFVTSMNALTSCPATSMGGAFPNIPLTGSLACVVGMGPRLTIPGAVSTQTVFPLTTGTVFAQQTTNNQYNGVGDVITLTGSDTRTPRGVGNIGLVAGHLVLRNAQTTTVNANYVELRLTISQKTPTMTAGGIAAAALLMLLGAGYALRSRY